MEVSASICDTMMNGALILEPACSDMDTVPVMHLSNWTMDAIPFRHLYIDRLRKTSSPAASIQRLKERSINQTTTESPIRAIISLECVPTWYSLRGA